MGLSEEEVTGLQLHRGSLENGMEREVRLVAEKRPGVQAVCGSGNKHSITRADTHQTEGRKAKNQWSCSSAVASSDILQNPTYMSTKKRQNWKGEISCGK